MTTIQTMDKILFLRMLMEGIGWMSAAMLAAMCLYIFLYSCQSYISELCEGVRARAARLDCKGEDNGR